MSVAIICAKCLRELNPGRGDFFEVRIDAVCDSSGPQLNEAKSSGEIREDIEKLLQRMDDVSEQDALDQVYRRLTIHLCNRCFSRWIDNPAGQ